MLDWIRGRAAAEGAALRSLGAALADLVWPPRCAACGEPTPAEPFCPVCDDAVLPVPSPCGRCGAPGLGPVCGACLASPPAFSALRAAALFGGPVADAVHELKYGDRSAVARPLGAWVAARVALPPGLVVAVPLGRRRRIERSYDQAALLADELAAAAGRSRDRLRGALRRVRETPPQVGRGRDERARNVRGAFAAVRPVSGREIVLVDDVVTTGATVEAASRALLEAGASRVTVVALARAE
jgi:ComF family protein